MHALCVFTIFNQHIYCEYQFYVQCYMAMYHAHCSAIYPHIHVYMRCVCVHYYIHSILEMVIFVYLIEITMIPSTYYSLMDVYTR